MDTSDPDITFDADGISNHWHFYQAAQRHLPYLNGDPERIDRVVDEIRQAGRGKDYDCVMGVSGGVDSTYVAYKAKELGLRPLAVHFDNGWNSELAVHNIERTLSKLKIDLHTFVIDWNEFKDLQLAYLRASVPNAEVPSDHAIYATLYKIAGKFGIGYMLSGSNIVTEAIMPRSWAYESVDATNLMAIHKRFGSGHRPTYPLLKLSSYFYYNFVQKVRKINLLDYFPFNKAEAMQTIERDLGWQYYGGKHYESIFTRFYQGYLLPRKFGYDKRRAHLSTLICSGQMTRDEALLELLNDPIPPKMAEEDKEYVLDKLGLSNEQFEEIMRAPPRSHLDFPNDRKWIERALKVKDYVSPRTS